MSDYQSFDDVTAAISEGFDGSDVKYNEVGRAAPTLCDINSIASQVTNMTVVRNNNGDVIGYDYIYTGPDTPDTTAMGVDSNADSGSFGSATGGGGHTSGGGAGRYRSSTYAGEIVDPDTSQYQDKLYSKGLVSSLISPTWAMVSALSKFGKDAASTAADALEAAGINFGLNFGPLTINAPAGQAIRALFGINDNEVTMYLDEDTIGALAIQARDDGLIASSTREYDYDSTDRYQLQFFSVPLSLPKESEFTVTHGTSIPASYRAKKYSLISGNGPLFVCKRNISVTTNYRVMALAISATPISMQEVAYNPTTGVVDSTRTIVTQTTTTYNGTQFYYCESDLNSIVSVEPYLVIPNVQGTDTQFLKELATIIVDGVEQGSGGVPGVSDQSGATSIVDAVTGADPHVVADNLYQQYPTVMGSPKSIVVMDDSCNMVEKKYYSIPISYSPTNLNITAPITGTTQLSPEFSIDQSTQYPDIDWDNFVDQIIKVLTGTGAGRDITTEPDDGELTPSKDISGDSPVIIPPTGTGVTPESTLPSTVPTAFWHVYNPSTADITAFAQWLWAGAFSIENFRKIFSNPMDAVIGVHAIYGEPHVSSAQAIVCGNIASTASARVVTSQYTSVDCGSVWLTEYYGNVFDYAPYTTVSLFLPFIGIVSLDVGDVMRSQLSITYNIDVFTGACNAQVSVIRDGVGGVLYQFGGNCAVNYPISGASYNNIIAGIIGVGVSAASAYMGLATPRTAGIALTSLASAATSTTSRSGAFSANVGAMGSKLPYLIITRPIPQVAIGFEKYDGLPANNQTRLSECHGYTRCKECHLNIPGAFKSELDEIDRLLHSGVILP